MPVRTASAKIRGDMQKPAGPHGGVVRHRDRTHGGPNARPDKAQPRVSLLFEPPQAAARVRDRLARGLKREAHIRAYKLIGALVSRSDAAIVIWK